MGMKNNKFGSDTRYVGWTCEHRTAPGYGVILAGPDLLPDHDCGLTESYVVQVRWDTPPDRVGTAWVNLAHLKLHSGRGPMIGQYGRRN